MPNDSTTQDHLNPGYGIELLLVVGGVLLVVALVAIAATSITLIVLAIVATSALAAVIAALVLQMTSDPAEDRVLRSHRPALNDRAPPDRALRLVRRAPSQDASPTPTCGPAVGARPRREPPGVPLNVVQRQLFQCAAGRVRECGCYEPAPDRGHPGRATEDAAFMACRREEFR
jgi:hypothetical protein